VAARLLHRSCQSFSVICACTCTGRLTSATDIRMSRASWQRSWIQIHDQLSLYNYVYNLSIQFRINYELCKKYFLCINCVLLFQQEEPVGYCVGTTGVSVFLTSFNNMLAFFMAALIPIPALRYFAIQVNAVRVYIYITTLIEK